MSRLPPNPKMQRRWVNPAQLLAALVALCIIPVVALAGALGQEARSSVIHVARGYEVIVPSDCTASNSPELTLHALEQMRLVSGASIEASKSLDLERLLA